MVEQLSLDFSVSAAVRHRKAVKAAEASDTHPDIGMSVHIRPPGSRRRDAPR
jgi:hypothetical protein